MKIKIILVSIVLLLVMVFASGCIPFMEKIGLINPANEEQLSPEKGGPPDGLVKVLIGFKEKPGAAHQAMVKGVGGKIKYTYHIVDAIAASIPEKAIDALRKNPNITHVEPDGEIFAVGQTLPWGVDRIDAEEVHVSGNKGTGVNVAILDTGIDVSHPDLSVIGGANFSPGKKSHDDNNGHGTHVAGIVAALDDGAGVIGVAPEVNLFAVKVLGDKGIGRWSDLIAGLEWCVDNGMEVANMSLGATSAPSDVKTACDSAYAAGVLLVAAAGNEYGGSVIYPAAYDSVIAVSATDRSDNLASFSSIGEKVELAAPGVEIYSTYKDGGYTTKSGTSMASPHVAGVAALVIAAGFPDVRNRLEITADYLGDSSLYGSGLVNAAEAAYVDTPLPGAIAGKVTDANNIAIVGATVVIEDTTLPEATTAENGDYIINNVPVGNYKVTASADGYESVSQYGVMVSADTTTLNVDFTLHPLSATGTTMHIESIDMSFKIAGKNVNAIATVTIVDASDNPVGGATVSGTWSGATGDSDSGITNTSGTVSLKSDKIKNLESGTFTFTVDEVTKDGYIPLISVKESGEKTFPE